MALNASEARTTASAVLKRWMVSEPRMDRLHRYLHGAHDGPYKPREANREYQLLIDRATTNWMPLIVSAVAQSLYVEGYRRSDQRDNVSGWRYWQANGLDARQGAVHRAALGYGLAYVTVLPGDPEPVIRGVSPRKMEAVYDDPSQDDWPRFAIRVGESGDKDRPLSLQLWDDMAVYSLTSSRDGDDVAYVDEREHGLGVCPVVRFANMLDLEGNPVGEVEPLVSVQDRINQTAFDMLMVQTFGSFKIRTVAGMTLSTDDEAARAEKLKIAADRFVVAEDPDTKFGSLDETPLNGFIDALEQNVRHLAAISQTPPHHLLGQMANLSAEALAAAESSLTRKVEERKKAFGEAWEQTLRLAAAADGDGVGASDVEAQVHWRDTEARSLSSTVDALGKAAQMLQIPAQALWEMVPGVSQTDVERWRTFAQEGDSFATLAAELERQAAGANF